MPALRPVMRTAAIVSTLFSLGPLLLPTTGCGGKKKSAPSREPMTWNGLALGMPVAKAKARLQALGTKVTCQEATTVMFLDAGTLTTQWVKPGERKRTERCDALAGVARKTGEKKPRGMLRTKLFFLDGTLRQLNVVIGETDVALGKTLAKRWGPPEQSEITVRLYAGKKEGSIRVFRYQNPKHVVLWLRRAEVQELIFLAHRADEVAPLERIASETKSP